jgi:hypothetical protein
MAFKPLTWERVEPSLLLATTAVYNFLHSPFRPRSRPRAATPADLPEVLQIRERACRPTDFSDHMLTLFHEAMEAKPGLIVELGTRSGESTFVLERVAALCGSTLVSVDLADCSRVSAYPAWTFVRAEDVAFAAEFPEWCQKRKLVPEIDLLFVDTSHEYEHTAAEIRAWFAFLSPRAKAVFHDTNLRKLYFRRDGTLCNGWDNQRGVIRAIEERLGLKLNERRDLILTHGDWSVRHWAVSTGLTVLTRLLH